MGGLFDSEWEDMKTVVCLRAVNGAAPVLQVVATHEPDVLG